MKCPLSPPVMSYQTEVISNQPQVTVTSFQISGGSSEWTSNACDCCEDCGICLCGTFLPCILGCKVAQDYGDSCCLPCLPGAMIALRTGIRNRYNIEGSICDDWVIMACCPLCGLCQMAREQKTRG
ncbi:cornifelin homolog [Clupea harengus]|uniref:Cornifelin homolog n=1 Tax=Clupea harengus TaxID=7950 RepID=A0A6P3WC12_CLUHA|nr:cornifelin homolog [Clupea harengus]